MTPTPTHNCPFYGQQMSFMFHLPDLADMLDPRPQQMNRPDFAPFHLLATQSNQCALITGSHSPCGMELRGEPIDWRSCPLIQTRVMAGSRQQ